ncbi:MAG: FtsX-like permease family protein [Promethearchaeota archaeon]
MTFRVLVKSLRLAVRTGKRFLFFVIIYAILLWWTSFSLDQMINAGGQFWPMLLLIAAVAVVALVYGLLISSYRKTQVATLRCLGWTSSDIKWLFIGELILVCFVAAFIDLEIIVHYLGIIGYYTGTVPSIYGAPPFLISLSVIVGVQFLGVFVAWRRMLNVRPMEALRKA